MSTEPRRDDRIDEWTVALLADIARQLAVSDTLDGTLQRAVDLAHQHVAGCDGATIMLIRPGGRISTPVHSARVAHEGDQVQYETGQGPCLEAIREDDTIVIPDVGSEERWPDFRRGMLELGLRSMLSFQLFVVADGEDTMGALNLYSREPDAFDERSAVMGRAFASHASVALKAAINAAGLEAALRSRDVIGQAKGVLMERERIPPAEAFDRLRRISQASNRPVREVAEEIAESGDVPDVPDA